jgi:hypothetical protein
LGARFKESGFKLEIGGLLQVRLLATRLPMDSAGRAWDGVASMEPLSSLAFNYREGTSFERIGL